MKKIALLFGLSLCAFFSFAQYPNNVTVSNPITRYHIPVMVGDSSIMLPVKDTLNNLSTVYKGAITVRPQDSKIYYSDGVYWHPLVTNSTGNITDTIYVEAPIAVRYDSSGHQIIYLKTLNGLVSGGVVTQDSCWYLGVSPPIYNIGFKQYVALNTSVHIDSSDVSLNRIDRIVADTFGIISVIKGTASMLAIAPPYNPSTQISIAEVPVPAGSTCVNVTNKVIADENLGVPTEWDFSTVGAIAADPDNTDNPYHLTKAIFVSTYVDSSQIVFTHTALVDTLTSSATLVMPMYLNNSFTNQLQIQFWYNDTAVSSNIVVNPYINTLDTGRYQVVGIPLQYFNFTSQYYNKAVLTWAGWDTSGAGGVYLDYIRIQGGIYNTIQNNWVDSTKIIAGSEYYYKKGIPYLAGAVGGGGTTQRFAYPSEDVLGLQDRFIDMQQHQMYIGNGGYVALESGDGVANHYAGVGGQWDSTPSQSEVSLYNNDGLHYFQSVVNATEGIMFRHSYLGGNVHKIFLPIDSTNSIVSDKYIALSVNGTPADATGNITISIPAGTNQKFNEEFTGSTSLTLTLSQTYTTGTIRLYKNGIRLLLADFTEASPTTITLNVARLSSDVFTVEFNY